MNHVSSNHLLAGIVTCVVAASALAVDDAKTSAQVSEPAPQTVVIESARKFDEKPYRKIFKGMDAFEKYHALAPNATLRFRLYPRAADTSFEGLTLKLAGDKTSVPVEISADHSFSLPRSQAAVDDDAYVTTNRKPQSFAWRVDIRSPGLPAGTRRLGDLRLECEVELGGADLAQKIITPATAAYLAVSDGCKSALVTYPFFADVPVFNITLLVGQRRIYVPSLEPNGGAPQILHPFLDWVFLQDHLYRVPFWDEKLPDDTLVEIDPV